MFRFHDLKTLFKAHSHVLDTISTKNTEKHARISCNFAAQKITYSRAFVKMRDVKSRLNEYDDVDDGNEQSYGL